MKKISSSVPGWHPKTGEAIKELARTLRDVHERLCDSLLSGKSRLWSSME